MHRRRRRIERLTPPVVLVSLVALVALAPPSVMSQAGDVGAADQPQTRLDRFLAEVETLQAEFEQQLLGADGRLIETQAGTLALERPDRFRWHYREPFEQLYVADGRNLWSYDVELEQVTVTPLDETTGSTPAMLLSGDLGAREGFEVVDELMRDGLDWVRLEPEIEGADFRSVLIGFEGLEPRRLELVDALNQVTRIELSQVELDPDLDESLFEFEPPKGVDVLGTADR